ncbi:MFS transporter [Paenibacillus swuensis]|uniref:MFS transporter n=2 Tax=Paenibacillus swuensis TaxID=1178515 RepID=A0A172TPU5_9BACL|nr:MFS transporter [Paenibacillus swuensis]ANE48783.1 MFS transporter [Paenibacillus swuensis]
MNNKAVRSWVMYDWANSAYATTMIAAVLPIYYKDVAGVALGSKAEVYWGYSQSLAMFLVAVLAPLLGAIADYTGRKVWFLRLFSMIGILASFCFAFVGKGDYILASVLLIIGTIGYTGGNTFYDALLPDVAPKEERDRVSSRGYAYGYIGGGILLALNLAMIQQPGWFGLTNSTAATQWSFITVGLWWFGFSLPIFRHMKDVPLESGKRWTEYATVGWRRLIVTFKQIKQYPELLKYMIAFWFFSDGISTIISMATIYGRGIGIDTGDLIKALLITQFVGFPFAILFGKLAERLGSKKSLYLSLGVYMLIVMLGYYMTSAVHFYLLAFMVGTVQGGSQAIARSIFSRLVPAGRNAEFFGFLSVSSKFSAMVGPFVFALAAQLTGSTRIAILSLLLFFIIGIALLYRVNLEKGEQEAVMSDRKETNKSQELSM